MVNIDSLPKSIEYNDNVYVLNMHVTAWNKLCICYQYIFGPKDALEKKIEYSILSQVVEPDCKEVRHTDEVIDIVDVKSWDEGFETLSDRVYTALDNGIIKLYK
jgi:hypothetical protein